MKGATEWSRSTAERPGVGGGGPPLDGPIGEGECPIGWDLTCICVPSQLYPIAFRTETTWAGGAGVPERELRAHGEEAALANFFFSSSHCPARDATMRLPC
eukprot:156411-Rhodomonas_salina.1